ncbi:MAG: Malate dehydrogenase (Oxaloacetate-decarboxylating) [Candidatus Moranbacteria bacterium GW2011_GWE2_35_2-]|nr:MAG: Malate dehydrogenase (Oxaloacetate-decarboxylating) [Candidatus Moranbacteria bacterium GW2011_GWE2_35_2-]KKQ06536.1 MAG: Malate dehydrogenase (Oxaloacetate-decarboxylating) [Candidatus Moranbacteria bacterium GW2011_GWF1_36_4]KKQ21904.1 MAG: Malate dehydrogenase (Oxaloacetate-decarboxylating) [Candidatus Moranbacteria bacterium GW2011_GWF2_37_11]KKQ29418.1 MAG: Malate dehydrogenase (Oxaloacetate-decarboxylating) [Candidatus Moranbacteria bacterium GW2011_GWD1_37_17]KKQ30713.1 MAG: Mala
MHKSIELSKKLGGKIEVCSKQKLTKDNLAVLYTPGVAEVSKAVAKNKKLSFEYTIRKNTVAVVSDGSAVLGLGNLGAIGALPVMEGKALLFKELGGVDAFPIVLDTQDTEEIIKIVKAIAPTFGGINLEDISAPRCFEIEERLKKELDIPVFHDDQHGTAIVVLAGLINALKVVGKNIKKVRIVISGAGAAGTAIMKLLIKYGAKNILMVDSQGIIFKERAGGLNDAKMEIAHLTNSENIQGTVQDALVGADVFIGVSAPNILKHTDISKMNEKSIVFAMSNPTPEIMPEEAKKGGAYIVATGRSDYPNQINNVLAFPGIFRGALDARVKNILDMHKIKAAKALANLVKKPNRGKIMLSALDKKAVKAVAGVFK